MVSDLGVWKTPVEPAPRLAERLGLRAGDLWVKRDDWLGLGGGGNKLRKLEHLCGEAVAAGATTLVTTGAAQSNYARLTAAAARRLGLDVVLCLHAGSGTGNLALDSIFGAERVLGVDTGAVSDPVERVAGFVRELGVSAGGLRLRLDQVGPGYERLTDAAERAISDAGRCEGLVLDPVYTAKGLAGLAAAVADGDIRPGERTVFVHTGGLPGLFGHPYAAELAARVAP